jgi:hypothetical protein
MKRLFFSAALLTSLLATAVAAQEAPFVEIQPRGGEWSPPTCHLTPERPEPTRALALRQRKIQITPVSDVAQCPGDPKQCGDHCIIDITGTSVGERDPRQVLKDALLRCNTTVRLGPDVDLDFADDLGQTLRPLRFGRCVTLTSVNNFDTATSQARTPHALGPVLKYGPPDRSPGGARTFLAIGCDANEDTAPSDHIRISGFRLIGPTLDHQYDSDVGIRIRRCVDVEISNMEIAGWGTTGISVENKPEEQAHRITDFTQVRIHDNFIHHNQHPSKDGHAAGYGVETSEFGPRAHVYRNVFDFNRHAIAADGKTGGYVAEENLVLKGGGYHGAWYSKYTHIFDVHGAGCSGIWPFESKDLCGHAGEEFRYDRNSFQYKNGHAIKIRGETSEGSYFARNVFPHEKLLDWGGLVSNPFYSTAIHLNQFGVSAGPSGADVIATGDLQNIIDTDTFGEYYSQCDFDADGVDDLFLATGATWWFSSSGKFHWSFLNTSSKRKKELRFGYFDDDDRCDVLTESGGIGLWQISSGGTGGWQPLPKPQGGIVQGFGAPLKDVVFGRFNPNDLSRARRTTDAFWRKANGEWHVTPLWNPDGWEYVGGSSFPLSELRFGDFTGDGVTDVLAVEEGRWAYSESARKPWKRLNHFLSDPVAKLYIANMDRDDQIEDILRFEARSKPAGDHIDVELIWWRSKNGFDRWREFKKYSFRYPSYQPGVGFVYPGRGLVGRFGVASGGTLVVDEKRIGHFFAPGSRDVAEPEWTSLFPY